MAHVKWTDVESFHNVRKRIDVMRDFGGTAPEITYRAKVKLHGTNGGVLIKANGEVFAQSRSCVITPGEDNCGFAKWVEEHKEYFSSLAPLEEGKQTVIFGEWAGKGIMKGTALNQLDEKIFAVFAVQIGYRDTPRLVTEPRYIVPLITSEKQPGNMYVIPWLTDKKNKNCMVVVDFDDKESLQAAVDTLNKWVEEIENEDPWLKSLFDVSGIGEGLVAYPRYNDATPPRGDITAYIFKAKGEKHKVVKQKKAVQIDPTQVATMAEFADLVLTEARLEQAVTEACDGAYDVKQMGNFMMWIGRDVKKECQAELEASNLEWKQVHKQVQGAARDWYLKKSKEI